MRKRFGSGRIARTSRQRPELVGIPCEKIEEAIFPDGLLARREEILAKPI